MEACKVVLATGPMSFRYVPPELSRLPESLCKHSTLIGHFRAYAGRDCTIVGAGQSALESAALLREGGAKVRVLARVSQIKWNSAPISDRTFSTGFANLKLASEPGGKACSFPNCLASSAGFYRSTNVIDSSTLVGAHRTWWLRERVEGKVDLLPCHQIQSANEVSGRVRLIVEGPEGKKEILTDYLIAATGFKANLARIDYLDSSLKEEYRTGKSCPSPGLVV